MMVPERIPSQEILAARRALEGIPGVAILNDWVWNEAVGKWVLSCRLSIDVNPRSPIQPATDWYVLVDGTYPWGSIKFHPSKVNGIVQTFHHQNYNNAGDLPWRDGDICLDTSIRVLGRHGHDIEPYDVYKRLRWRFQRAVQWLNAASSGELIRPGEPYELPQFPKSALQDTVVFCEGQESFARWKSVPEQVGIVEFGRKGSNLLFTKVFKSALGADLWIPSWGHAMAGIHTGNVSGIWLRVNSAPALFPWQAPATLGELRKACREQGIELDDLLKVVVRHVRDGERHIALIGFPISARVGDVPVQMYWQAFMFPAVSTPAKPMKGFRANERGYWQHDRSGALRGETKVDWLASENWDAEQISARGRMSLSIRSRQVLLIGAGTIGSAAAELLVRAGVHNLTIMDGDRLEAGNLVRHTLDLEQIGEYKAGAMANRLNQVVPHASVSAINSFFPPIREADRVQVQKCEIILDCTGRDEVLHHLHSFSWEEPKLFYSISIGFRARRLFLFKAYGDRFPHPAFRDQIGSWLEKEMHEQAGEEFPREGVGCWHPVFPARVDDIWMLASIAVKNIETAKIVPMERPQLIVFEQHYEQNEFVSVCRCDE